MKKQRKKRLLSIFMAAVMGLSLLPAGSAAAAPTAKTVETLCYKFNGINANRKVTDAPPQYIWFGEYEGEPIKWRVLTGDTDRQLLLSEYILGPDINVEVQKVPNGFPDTSWASSPEGRWCRDFSGEMITSYEVPDAFSPTETEILNRYNASNTGGQTAFGNEWVDTTLKNAIAFIPSAKEVEDHLDLNGRMATRKDGTKGKWLLRSRAKDSPAAGGFIESNGQVFSRYTYEAGIRPAIEMCSDRAGNQVAFTTAAVDGKPYNPMEELTKIEKKEIQDWKVTIMDRNRTGFQASVANANNARGGEYVTVSYSGAKTGANEFVAVQLFDASRNAIYTGKIANNSESGEASFKVPFDLDTGSYILSVYNEQDNGNYKTDYCSNMVDIGLYVLAWPKEVTVTYHPGLGDGEDVITSGWTDSPFALPACPEGFIAPEGKEFYRWDLGRVNEEVTISGPVTIVAKWKDKTNMPGAMIMPGIAALKEQKNQAVNDDVQGNYKIPSSYVWFGNYENNPVKWRVLDSIETSYGKEGAFLLSENLMGYNLYGTSEFQKTWLWEFSSARKKLTEYSGTTSSDTGYVKGSVLSAAEMAALTPYSYVKRPSEEMFGYRWEKENGIAGRLFLLSAQELCHFVADYSGAPQLIATEADGTPKTWWLRSIPADVMMQGQVGMVGTDGKVGTQGYENFFYLRPAMNLEKDRVLFCSAAQGGKPTEPGLHQIPAYDGNEWKLTVQEYNETAYTFDASADYYGNISYQRADVGNNFYISMLIQDNETKAYTHYGRLVKPDAREGRIEAADLNFDGIDLTKSTVYIFNEQCNEDYKTDFASPLVKLTMNTNTKPMHKVKVGLGGNVRVGHTENGDVEWYTPEGASELDVHEGDSVYLIDYQNLERGFLAKTASGKKIELGSYAVENDNYLWGFTMPDEDVTVELISITKIDEIKFEITPPAAGAAPDMTVTLPQDALYVQSGEAIWYGYTASGDVREMNPAADRFEAGGDYGFYFRVAGTDEFHDTASDEKLRVVVNGERLPDSMVVVDAGQISIKYHVTETGSEPVKMLSKIQIMQHASKTEYEIGDTFDPAGLILYAFYGRDSNNGEPVEGYVITNGENLRFGQTKVMIEFTQNHATCKEEESITVTDPADPDREPISLSSIEITTPPIRTNYEDHDDFDKTGMTVVAHYSDGTSEEILDYLLKDAIQMKEGQKFVRISYTLGDIVCIATQPVNVRAKGAPLPAEEEATVTFKVVGGTWDGSSSADRTVKVTLTDGKGTLPASQVPKGMTASKGYEGGSWDTEPDTAEGAVKGNITYSFIFTKTAVNPDLPQEKTLAGIEVTTSPDRTEYTEGEDFDPAGMAVTARYSDGSEQEVDTYTVTDGSGLTKDRTYVTVSYEENNVTATARQAITVTGHSLSGVVIITGIAKVGETLTADISGIADAEGTLSYSWKCGGNPVGTDADTYAPAAEDIGKTVTVTVTSDALEGSLTSAPTAKVEAEDAPLPTTANYTVTHMKETLAGNYELAESQTLNGVIDADTEAKAKNYPGFTAQGVTQSTVAADGSTKIEIRYSRSTYLLTWDMGEGTADNLYTEGDVKYGELITAPIPVRDGFSFDGWDKKVEASMPAHDLAYTAKWKQGSTPDPQPSASEAVVTFQIRNGKWSDGTSSDLTVKVALTDGKGTLPADQVPAGMTAAEGYEGGSWNITPDTKTDAVTGNRTYTYSFTKKESGGGSSGTDEEGSEELEDDRDHSSSGSSSSGSSASFSSSMQMPQRLSETIVHDTKKGTTSEAQGVVTGALNGSAADGLSHWQQGNAADSGTWQFQYADGTYLKGSLIEDAAGNVQEQVAWEKVNGKWYAFGADGYADQGWVYDHGGVQWYYLDINNGMQTGWININNVWYYLTPVTGSRPLGSMYKNERTPDGYYVDANGAWIP